MNSVLGPFVMVSDGASGGSRDAVVAIRALAAGGYRVAVAVATDVPSVPLSRYVTTTVRTPGNARAWRTSGQVAELPGKVWQAFRRIGMFNGLLAPNHTATRANSRGAVQASGTAQPPPPETRKP